LIDKSFADFLIMMDALKDIPRTGWVIAGLTYHRGESVAEHSWGTGNIALLIGTYYQKTHSDLDLQKILSMSIIHDYPEVRISDIPKTTVTVGSLDFARVKHEAETKALTNIFNLLSKAGTLEEIWNEYEESKTLEARIVRAAYILDMIVHAVRLEESGASPSLLNHFFENSEERLEHLQIPIAMKIFGDLSDKHKVHMNSK